MPCGRPTFIRRGCQCFSTPLINIVNSSAISQPYRCTVGPTVTTEVMISVQLNRFERSVLWYAVGD